MKNNTSFILLAGGKSERMGVDKGLLKYQQTYWILEQLQRVSKTSIKNVYIGLGYHYKNYFKAIPWFEEAITVPVQFMGLNVKIEINSRPQFGAFSTLQTVLKTITANYDVLINHVDIPILNVVDSEKIIATKNTVVIPTFHHKKGHPVKLSYPFWEGLLAVAIENEEARLDYQLKNLPASSFTYVEVKDSVITKNLNTKKEWILYLKEIN